MRERHLLSPMMENAPQFTEEVHLGAFAGVENYTMVTRSRFHLSWDCCEPRHDQTSRAKVGIGSAAFLAGTKFLSL